MTRLAHAWRALEREQRLAAVASLGLFMSMFLPWYSKTYTFVERGAAKATQTSLSAFDSFSFVEAAVLLVSAGVLATLFARVERRVFQLPGGDGLVVMIAGGWTALLIFFRLLDKPGLQGTQRITATVGVQWGIFIALLLALGLGYAGARMRAAERAELPLVGSRGRPRWSTPSEDPTPSPPSPQEDLTTIEPAPARPKGSTPVAADPRAARGRPRYPPAPSEQMSLEDPPPSAD
jgi:hypothetical protein